LIRKVSLGLGVVLVVCVAVYVRLYRPKQPAETAYAGNRQVTLWNTTAQVREPVATVNFGDPLKVLRRFQGHVQVRSTKGVTGWVDQHDLLSADLWQKASELETLATRLPIEARGHTRVLSNLHIEAGRDSPHIRQLTKNVPLDLLERRAVEVSAGAPEGNEEEVSSEPAETKKEDWWLVEANIPDQPVLAGWVLRRFIDLDVPRPLPDYASSGGIRIIAWFELNRVTDPSGNARPQYLVAGSRGSEGQPCDFTLLRVYTWSTRRQSYETAYVESDLCGKLPVTLTRAATLGGEVTFVFEDTSNGAPQQRTYRMHQTVVRRVRENGAPQPYKHAS
jgi:hypothetical protein